MHLFIGLQIIYLLALAIAALVGCLVYNNIPHRSRIFVFFLCSEIVFGLFQFCAGANDAALSNWMKALQSVIGTTLLCWQAYRWKVFAKNRVVLFGIILLALSLGVAGMFTIDSDLPFWLAISPGIIRIAIGLVLIRFGLVNEAGTDLQKPMLSIGAGLFVYYTFAELLMVLSRMGDVHNQDFLGKAFLLYIPFGIMANLLFIRAVLWLPGKNAFPRMSRS